MRKTSVPKSEHGEPPRGNSNIKVSVWGRTPEQAIDRYRLGYNPSRQIGEEVLERVGNRWRVTWSEQVGLAEVVTFFGWKKRKKGDKK
tara:strand:+ start:90 stop:353 length:264 start_codon:yes stop_codon:yes gene_type:complete